MRKFNESNYEFLRILSMFGIVLWHTIMHGHVIENTTDITKFIFNAIMLIIIVHVNVFMLITGYYQSQSTFKLKKLISLIFQIWFYNIIINTFLMLTNIVEYTNVDYLKMIMFYNNSYWYLECYIIVYLLSPFFNKVIKMLDRKDFKKLIFILIFCLILMPFFSGGLFYFNDGSNLNHYIMLYFIGAYIRKYNLNKNLLKNYNSIQKRTIFFSLFLLCFLMNLFMYYFSLYLGELHSNILVSIANVLKSYKYYYSNPIVIIQSLSIFLFFGTFNLKNKFINKISSLTLGVYIIHDATYIRANIYKWLKIDNHCIIYGKSIILKVLICAFLIFIFCLIIEGLRIQMLKLVRKTKIYKIIDQKFMTIMAKIVEIK